ncbi:MAG: curli assembly protein CsgF [Pseudomonadota bacterium]
MRWIILLLVFAQAASLASELIYTPINPAFGGNPLNGPVLLNEAQAINNYKDPALAAQQKTPAQQFSDTLQRSIVSRLSFSAASGLVDANGNLIATSQPLQTADFTITITNLAGTGEMQVSVVDKVTGQTTQFSVCQPTSAVAGATACVP